ncbi:MAG: S-adenosylmethionine decarboxylase [Candidatus Caenarcaniphilales bacterium]|nr:S-adenosylmethionine decarboxylase [Candidatus Caenarcaniphilales bacterium]
MFGPHLVVEGYDCKRKDRLADKNVILNLLQEFPAKLDMTTIMQPQVMYYDGGDIPDDCGASGFVIIAESHIAIHSFSAKGFFTLDIFSCKPFDVDAALKYVCDYFEPGRYEYNLFDRGREFPRSIGRSSQIVAADRCRFQDARNFTLATAVVD